MLFEPAFDQVEIEAWRTRQLEGVARRIDDPARLAYSELNRLLFGDHPIGWEMGSDDLAPDRLSADVFRALHKKVICRDNIVMGITGDIGQQDLDQVLEHLIKRIPPCAMALPEPPTPDIRRAQGVFLIEKDLDQSVIAMAHPSDVRLSDEPEYFAALMGNAILGGGGFFFCLFIRVRREYG